MGRALKEMKFNFKGPEPSSTLQYGNSHHGPEKEAGCASAFHGTLFRNLHGTGQVCFNMKTRQPPPHPLGIFAVITLVFRI